MLGSSSSMPASVNALRALPASETVTVRRTSISAGEPQLMPWDVSASHTLFGRRPRPSIACSARKPAMSERAFSSTAISASSMRTTACPPLRHPSPNTRPTNSAIRGSTVAVPNAVRPRMILSSGVRSMAATSPLLDVLILWSAVGFRV